jgi:mono/diheme cytochrome c family protein
MKRTGFALLVATAGLAAAIACGSDAGSPASDAAKRAAAVSPEMLEKGRGIYKSTCAPCHGESGRGDGPASKIFKPPPRDHTDAVYMDTITDEDMGKTIQMGGALKGKPLMPSNPQIRGEELNALVAYVRSLSRSSQ